MHVNWYLDDQQPGQYFQGLRVLILRKIKLTCIGSPKMAQTMSKAKAVCGIWINGILSN